MPDVSTRRCGRLRRLCAAMVILVLFGCQAAGGTDGRYQISLPDWRAEFNAFAPGFLARVDQTVIDLRTQRVAAEDRRKRESLVGGSLFHTSSPGDVLRDAMSQLRTEWARAGSRIKNIAFDYTLAVGDIRDLVSRRQQASDEVDAAMNRLWDSANDRALKMAYAQ